MEPSFQRREIVHVGVTEHPTAEWAAQRVVEAIGERAPPRFFLHDRDSIYGGAFRRRVSGLDVRELVTPPRAPTANAYCERVVGTLRRDCLDHVLVWDERQAERLLREYVHFSTSITRFAEERADIVLELPRASYICDGRGNYVNFRCLKGVVW
jgi:transposase InsO family protein